MKKFFLLSALALGAITMSAQIELIGTFSGEMFGSETLSDCGKFAVISEDTAIAFYNIDLTLYKKVTFQPAPSVSPRKTPQAITGMGYRSIIDYEAKNLYTTDGKIGFIRYDGSSVDVYDEDKTLIKHILNTSCVEFGLRMVDGDYYLIVRDYIYDSSTYQYNATSYIYSLPGHGISTSVEAPNSSVRTSNARKVIENGQMYIILDGVKYAVTGSTTL